MLKQERTIFGNSCVEKAKQRQNQWRNKSPNTSDQTQQQEVNHTYQDWHTKRAGTQADRDTQEGMKYPSTHNSRSHHHHQGQEQQE